MRKLRLIGCEWYRKGCLVRGRTRTEPRFGESIWWGQEGTTSDG